MIYPVVILYGSNDKSYRYCRILIAILFFSFALRSLPYFQAQKSRLSADVCQDLAIYGLFRYAHRSQYCINPKHLCSMTITVPSSFTGWKAKEPNRFSRRSARLSPYCGFVAFCRQRACVRIIACFSGKVQNSGRDFITPRLSAFGVCRKGYDKRISCK